MMQNIIESSRTPTAPAAPNNTENKAAEGEQQNQASGKSEFREKIEENIQPNRGNAPQSAAPQKNQAPAKKEPTAFDKAEAKIAARNEEALKTTGKATETQPDPAKEAKAKPEAPAKPEPAWEDVSVNGKTYRVDMND